MMVVATKTDALSEWSLNDDVIRLREWGCDRVHLLPVPPIGECLIGSGEDCALRFKDERVSHRHAMLSWRHGKWWVTDLGSKNGTRRDGVRQDEAFVLDPGLEVGIGGIVLVAESTRLIELRSFCARIMGWSEARASVVDGALRSIRHAATLRTALLFIGDCDLVPIARAMHRHTLGATRPFVVCDPERRDTKESARSPANYESALAALHAASGGSLCVRGERMPRDFSEALERIRDADARVQLMVCARKLDIGDAVVTVPIRILPLKKRAKELPRIIDEYIQDAAAELDASPHCLTREDHQWILEHSANTLPEIEKAAMRLVALHTSPSIARAAARLRIAPVSLTNWIDRKSLTNWIDRKRYI